jgi:acetyl-CoA synthetase
MIEADNPRLEAYRFYEQDYDSYQQIDETFEWEIPESFNMAAALCDRWAEDKSKVAFFYETADGREQTYTYWHVQQIANSLANYFAARGVERGDRIGITIPQRPEVLIAHIAAWKLGAVSIPLSMMFGPDALEYRLDDAAAAAYVVHDDSLDAARSITGDLDALQTVLTLDAEVTDSDKTPFWDAVKDHSPHFETVDTSHDDNAMILYTSGTTSDPKGVLYGHEVVLGYVPAQICAPFNFDVRPSDVPWAPPEWSWNGALFGIVLPSLFLGRPQLAYDGRFDPTATFRLIEKYGLTNLFLPPSAFRMMRNTEGLTDEYELGTVRSIVTGGESITQPTLEWASDVFDGAVINEAYGQTEFNPLVCDCQALFEFREGTMGRPTLGRDVRVIDAETATDDLEPGEVGEIAVRYEDDDPSLFKRYWNKPERTAEKFENGWFLTEDLGKQDADGYVTFVGRKDDVITSSGYRIGPAEVEEQLESHEAVVAAGVIGVPHETLGHVVKAFLELVDGKSNSPELQSEIQSYVKETLAKHEYPREIEVLEGLPATTTGKIRRAELREIEGIESH